MIPVIALVGRPNVGKSTLFNVITKTRDALVFDMPGVTRDRKYGDAEIEDKPFIVIDTGGLTDEDKGIDSYMAGQSILAIEEADVVFFMVDGRSGITSDDQYIAGLLRSRGKPTYLVVNKTDGLQEEIACADFYELGFSEPMPIAASHKRGVYALLEQTVLPMLEAAEVEALEANEDVKGIKFALIGKPNVGKSTLTNRMIGEERVVVYDLPGTTRDSIYIPFEREGQDYTIIDTAGVRRRSRVNETLEKFSVVKTLQAIRDADVVVIVVDAQEGLTEQDVSIVGFALHAGRALVIAINKWDGMSEYDRDTVKSDVKRKLIFVTEFAEIHFISALHGTNVGHLFKSIKEAYRSATKKINTQDLTTAMKIAIQDHAPPVSGKARIKPKYAHMGGHRPPVIVIHGNQVEKLSNAYQRYLMNFFREAFELVGTPIRLELKSSDNPFKDQKIKPKLRPEQERKRERFTKKMKR
ncbi:ribosome biogenesis GTPase Der [Francisellaceae bacterium]|nr:ribosome biogenesis GTPase Der [Francisellaceae bacterium]